MKAQKDSKQGRILREYFKLGMRSRNASFTMAGRKSCINASSGSQSASKALNLKGKLWIPNPYLEREILKATHDHPLTSHPGREKLLDLVVSYFPWSDM